MRDPTFLVVCLVNTDQSQVWRNLSSWIETGTKSQFSIEFMRSPKFANIVTDKLDIKPNLFATDYYDRETGKVYFKADIYNQESQIWTRKVRYPLLSEPSKQEVYERFFESVTIAEDRRSKLVTIRVSNESPDIARKIALGMISEINAYMRKKEVSEASRAIQYLEQQIQQTSLADVTKSLYGLIEAQHQKKMLAETRADYVFETVVPVYTEDFPDARPIMLSAIIGAAVGLMFAVFVISAKRWRLGLSNGLGLSRGKD